MLNIRKILGIFIILIFITICSISLSTGKMILDDTIPPITTHTFTPEVPNGENGWYVSDVFIELNATDEGSGVNVTYYKIYQYDDWTKYTDVLTVTEDDYDYSLFYYSVDNAGNIEDVKGPYDFKIDQTGPIIVDFLIEQIEVDKYQLIMDAYDDTSGFVKVEFYVNDELYGEVFEYPWEIIYTGLLPVKVQAIVFDHAGNAAVTMPSERPIIHVCLFGIIHDVELLDGYMILQGTGLFFGADFPFFSFQRDFLRALPLDFEGYMGEKFILARFTY